MSKRKRTILIYGRSRSGKSTQLAELAEYVYKTEGKPTRLYTADRGGVDPLIPLIELGVIEVVEQLDTDPWIFLNQAVRGAVRNKEGKWVPGKNDGIGMFAFESMTAFADALMNNLAAKAAMGVNIGGSANVSFVVQGDGESLKIGGSNMAHYNISQTRITDEVWQSQRLDAPYIAWTASASKDEDQTAGGKVIGPAVVGKALTSEVPRWFGLTFRIDSLPADAGKPERHILYLGNSIDKSTNAISLGNTRVPLDAPALPSQIEPASIVKALNLIDDAHKTALDIAKKRLGLG